MRSAATFSTGIITSATTFTMNFLVASDENELLGVHNDENELLDVRAYRASSKGEALVERKPKKENIKTMAVIGPNLFASTNPYLSLNLVMVLPQYGGHNSVI